jgi:hypothetical protein
MDLAAGFAHPDPPLPALTTESSLWASTMASDHYEVRALQDCPSDELVQVCDLIFHMDTWPQQALQHKGQQKHHDGDLP